MSFLSELEKYIKKYNTLLKKHDFKVAEKKDGSGLGAFLKLSNGRMTFSLLNDKGQFFLRLEKDNKSIDLALLLSFIKLENEKRELKLMTFEEKTRIWEINYSYSDPLDSLFRNFKELDSFITRITVVELKELEQEYSKDRGKWLFR
ncbi:MAG: hypothetical protein PHG47_11335 [Sulfuricella sp.]|nr:hypothetical protein [Sulfuricella sp.]